MKVNIGIITEEHLEELYKIKYSSKSPKWSKYNAPYFNEYKYIDIETFYNQENYFLNNENLYGIFYNSNIVGIVSRYWECRETKWLEIGIIIFVDDIWSKGIGYESLKLWINKCFIDFEDIQRVGLTTWSGNISMMKLSEKLNMKQEACIRKVRYYNGIYYDSIKYGILRNEFYNKGE